MNGNFLGNVPSFNQNSRTVFSSTTVQFGNGSSYSNTVGNGFQKTTYNDGHGHIKNLIRISGQGNSVFGGHRHDRDDDRMHNGHGRDHQHRHNYDQGMNYGQGRYNYGNQYGHWGRNNYRQSIGQKMSDFAGGVQSIGLVAKLLQSLFGSQNVQQQAPAYPASTPPINYPSASGNNGGILNSISGLFKKNDAPAPEAPIAASIPPPPPQAEAPAPIDIKKFINPEVNTFGQSPAKYNFDTNKDLFDTGFKI